MSSTTIFSAADALIRGYIAKNGRVDVSAAAIDFDAPLPIPLPSRAQTYEIEIAGVSLTSSMGVFKVPSARLILDLVEKAERTVLLLCRDLRPGTYDLPAIVTAFTKAAENGVEIWIIIEQPNVDLARPLIQALAPYAGYSFFLATMDVPPEFEKNFLLVDDRLFRYEDAPETGAAHGACNDELGDVLWEDFCAMWDRAKCLNAPEPPSGLTFEHRPSPNPGGLGDFYCTDFPGIIVDRNTADPKETAARVCRIAATTMNVHFSRQGMAYKATWTGEDLVLELEDAGRLTPSR